MAPKSNFIRLLALLVGLLSVFVFAPLKAQENPYGPQIDSLEEVLLAHTEVDTVQGRILFQLVMSNLQAGNHARAFQLDSQALALSETLGWKSGVAEAQEKLGRIHMRKGTYDQATLHYELGLALREGLGDKKGMARNLNNLGVLQQYQGKQALASDYYLRTVALAEELGDTLTMAGALSNVANIAAIKKEHVLAMEYLEQAITLQEGSTKNISLPHNYITLGSVLRKQGRLPDAVVATRKALRLYESQENLEGQINAWRNMGKCYKADGLIDSAKYSYQQSLRLAEITQNVREVGNAYSNLGSLYMSTSEFVQARDAYRGALHAYQITQNPKWLAASMVNMARASMKLDQQDSAVLYFQQLAMTAHASDEPEVYIDAYFRMGRSYRNSGMLPLAQESYLEAYRMALVAGSEYNEAKALNNLAIMASAQKDLEKAKSYYLLAAQMHTALNETAWLLSDMEGLGATLISLGDYDSALVCFQTCTELLENLDRSVSPGILQGKGRAYYVLEEWDQAEALFLESLALYEQKQNLIGQANSKRYLGNIYYQRKEYAKALAWLRESLTHAEASRSLPSQIGANRNLAEVYAQLEQGMRAYEHHQAYVVLKDSLLNEENLREATRLEEQFAFDREKERLLQLQEQEELLLQAEIDRQDVVQYALLGGTGLLLVLLIQVGVSFRRKQQQNHQIATQNTQLKSLSEFKDVWTQMVAHDMKNSLNTIIGYSAHALEDQRMHRINQSGQVMLNLVTNMLDIQKFEEASVVLDRTPVQVLELVEKVKSRVAFLYQMEHVLLEVEIPEGIEVQVDRAMMERVLVNLLSNAAKYSEAGSRVTVRWQAQDSGSLLQVIDQGEGIAEADLPHIFEKFYQVDARSTGFAASNGLGLTFCKLAVEAHGGTLSVASQVGEGTTFSVLFPAEYTEVTEEIAPVLATEPTEEVALLSAREEEALAPLRHKFQALRVYEAVDIFDLLEGLPAELKQSEWKRQIEQSVKTGNAEHYASLVQVVRGVVPDSQASA